MTADYHMIVIAQSGQAAREMFLPKYIGARWQAHLPDGITERVANVGGPVLTTVLVASYTEALAATAAARAKAAASEDRFDRDVVAYCDRIAEHLEWSGGTGFASAWVIVWSSDID